MSMNLREPLLPLAGTGVLATLNRDGTPLQTRAVVFYDGEAYYFRTEIGAPELDNLRRDPRLSICIRDPLQVNHYIVVRGSAIERRVQPSYQLVYIRIAVDPDGEPVRTDTDG